MTNQFSELLIQLSGTPNPDPKTLSWEDLDRLFEAIWAAGPVEARRQAQQNLEWGAQLDALADRYYQIHGHPWWRGFPKQQSQGDLVSHDYPRTCL